MIIAIEGPNGCGKTTLMKELNKKFIGQSVIFLNIKEHTALPERVLSNLKNRTTNEFTLHDAMYLGSAHLELLYQAKKLSDQGKIVILDRSIASYFVYQVVLYEFYGLMNISESVYTFINHVLLTEFNSVYSIYMDIPYMVLEPRLEKRGDSDHLFKDLSLIISGYQEFFSELSEPSYIITDQSSYEDCVEHLTQLVETHRGEVYV